MIINLSHKGCLVEKMSGRIFLIKLTYRYQHGNFKYFEAAPEDDYKKMACEVANQYLSQRREADEALKSNPYHRPYRPFSTIDVVEWDERTGKTKWRAIKFKLHLANVITKLPDGKQIQGEWYVAD